jgi:ubiquitin-like protein 4
MSELQFAKSFLTTLDNKSTKYQPDHIFDPRTTALRVPYTLPRLPHPPHPLPPKSGPETPLAPGAEKADEEVKFDVVLKSGRNPTMSLTVSDVSAQTSVQSLKDAVQLHLGGAGAVDMAKIKILLNKKPIPSGKKTLGEAMGTDMKVSKGESVELGVFVMGGAKDPVAKAEEVVKPATPVPGPVEDKMEGVETKAESEVEKVVKALGQESFWQELQDFLQTKLGDGESAKRVQGIFREAWSKQGS